MAQKSGKVGFKNQNNALKKVEGFSDLGSKMEKSKCKLQKEFEDTENFTRLRL
jgi:hypothetical protein